MELLNPTMKGKSWTYDFTHTDRLAVEDQAIYQLSALPIIY